MSDATLYTTVYLSIGPVDIYVKDTYALGLLNRLQLQVLSFRRELDGYLNNAMLRDACPVLMPVAALMLTILSHPSPTSPVVEQPGSIVETRVPAEYEPLTIGDLCVIIGVTQGLRRPDLPPSHLLEAVR